MRRLTLFLAGVAIVGNLAIAQDNRNDLRVMVVGLAARNYQESMDFYTKVMGFKAGFSFSPDGKRMNTYFQLSRESFIEMSEAAANAAPGFTHIHMQTGDRDAVVARLQKSGVLVSNIRIAMPTMEKSATITDPSGIRFEPTELIAGSMTKKAVDAWNESGFSPRVLVAGIAVKDYPASQNFYGKLLGFPVAFSFASADGQRITTYYQASKESFLEMQSATEAMPAGITHVHIQVPDVAAAVARLRQLGLPAPARGATTPKTASDPGVTQPSNVKSANVYDPQGLRLELNELIPESQTKKAMDAWK
jgi:catechol 2,3-dioxygenase-like lactoylglutathione lyase family enzyme